MEIIMSPLAYIHSDYSEENRPPKQSVYNQEATAFVEVLPEYRPAMLGLEPGKHVIISFHFHKSKEYKLQHIPHGGTELRGLFATRTPNRPNGIGQSICEITDVKEDGFTICGVDMFDGTPVLDIKIYSPRLNPEYTSDQSSDK